MSRRIENAFRQWPAKIQARLRRHGFGEALAFLWARLLRVQRHQLYIASCNTAAQPQWLPDERAISCSQARPWDRTLSDKLLSIAAGNREYLNAVSRGEAEGLAVFHAGTLVHYGFLMHGNKTACLLGFGRSVGLLGNAFTIPNYRGRGCQIRSVAARIRMAQQAGLERVISETGYENTASQRNIVKGGMTHAGRMELLVVLNVLVVRYKRPTDSIPLFGFCP